MAWRWIQPQQRMPAQARVKRAVGLAIRDVFPGDRIPGRDFE